MSTRKKFLCDQMCAQLGHWLRAAGYDTVIIDTPLKDPDVFKRSIEENRLLLTRDRYFKEMDPEGKRAIYLRSESLDDWAEQLGEEGIDWLFCPFTRCLKCNTLFQKNQVPEDFLKQLPEGIEEFWFCANCKQLFWMGSHTARMEHQLKEWNNKTLLTIGLGGDLMIGRLVDEYLDLAPPAYVWGNLLPLLLKIDFNLINLETTLTNSENIVPKVFNFKAKPNKIAVLTEGAIHAVNIANNHILDFSEQGLLETIERLDQANILHVGAGKDMKTAKAPVIIEKKGIKIGLFGCTDNEPSWKASASHPGTHFVEVGNLKALHNEIISLRKEVDLLILSIHWGPNMLKKPAPHFRTFAHALIDLGVDILHGHSAHVFQGVENYKGKLILYDTGELIDDYAIDPFLRNDRSFFFVIKANKKKLLSLQMIPTRISHFQVNISKENEQLEEMEALCKEFQTYPLRKEHTLTLDL